MELFDARDRLLAQGLYVSMHRDESLWIADEVSEEVPGIRLAKNACAITRRDGQVIGIFPGKSRQFIEVPGTIEGIVTLTIAIFAEARDQPDRFNECAERVIREHGTYRELNPVA